MRTVPRCFRRFQSQQLLPRVKMESEDPSAVFSPAEAFSACLLGGSAAPCSEGLAAAGRGSASSAGTALSHTDFHGTLVSGAPLSELSLVSPQDPSCSAAPPAFLRSGEGLPGRFTSQERYVAAFKMNNFRRSLPDPGLTYGQEQTRSDWRQIKEVFTVYCK